MPSLNQCNFIGNVGMIETRYTANGEMITNLSLAVNEKYKNKAGEMVENTEWVRASFFGKLAEVAQMYVHKGDPIYISGSMKTRKYTDKDGVEKYATEIRGQALQMLGSKTSESKRDEPSKPTQSGFDDMGDDIIPF